MAKREPYIEPLNFTHTVDGEEIHASYTYDRRKGLVTVQWEDAPPETTQVGNKRPEELARMMLGPLVRKARGRIR